MHARCSGAWPWTVGRAPSLYLCWALAAVLASPAQAQTAPASAAAAKPALTVAVTSPQRADWPVTLPVSGNIVAWQEAVIGVEGAGGRIVELPVQVGDKVRKGQLLARLQGDSIAADLAQTRAALVEAQAVLAEAAANAARARELQASGMISTQGAVQALTAEQTARARVDSVQARLRADELRQAQTRLLAPDDGVISARTATLGAVAQPGQELFKLIRQQRLEWRAELPSADLARVSPGLPALLTTPSGQSVRGQVRVTAPTVDPATRNGLVLVDLAPGSDARPGMFARGVLQLGQASGLTLPQSAVLLRDGHAVVLRVGPGQRVQLTRVGVGRRQADRVEITAGLAPDAVVVASGGAFLADGDVVKVVPAAQAAGSAASALPVTGGAAGARPVPGGAAGGRPVPAKGAQ